MRKTVKKLTQGATRLLVFALGLGLATTAWAATLSSSGYISKDSANPTAVFSGVRLSDIGTKYVLAGKMGGKWVSTKEAAGVYNASSDGTTLTVQFQKVDGDSDKYVKCVIVKFTEATVNDVNTIYAYAHATGNSQTLVLGQDFSSATGTPSTGDSVEGYGMFDLSLTAGKKFEFKTTGTESTYETSGGQAAKPFWTLKVPTSTSLPENTLVKLTDIRIGSRATSWTVAYDSAYMCVTNVNNEGIYSSQVSAYVANRKLMWGSTPVNVLQYQFPDSTPVMVKAGVSRGVVCYYADKTYAANNNNPGGAYLVASGENVPYALNMNPYLTASWRPVQEVEVLVVATATASANANWSTLAWSNGAADWTAAGSTPVLLTVTEDCTITLDSTVSLESVIFDITPGKTLTIAGSNNLTAANGIVVKGGTISMTSSLLRGTVYGNGTIYYNGVRPTTSGTDVILTDSDWRGTVRITYNYLNTATSTARQLFPQHWGSANSKIMWNGVAGYFGGCTSKAGWILEDLTVDATTYPALKKNDGSSTSTTTAPSLEGSGEFADASNPSERFHFATGSSFSGKINITSSAGYGMNVQFGETAVNKIAGTIHVLSGATMTVAANKTWAATGGIVVNGTLNVASGATIPAIATGSNGSVIAASGTVTITGVQGNAISAGLGMIGGTIAVSGATSLTELTIPADTTLATQTFFAQGGGKLDLSACTSLTTLNLNLGSSTTFDLGNVILPASCTTVKYVVAAGSLRDLSGYTAPTGLGSLTWGLAFAMTETREEYAKGTFSVANVPANATVTVTRCNGTSATATVTDGTARLSDYGEPKVSGDACWHAYEFNNNWTDSVSTGAHDCKTWNSSEPNFAADADKDGNYFVYTAIRPGPTDSKTAYSYPAEWSAAIRCTVPQTANSIIVCFGKVTNSAGQNQYIALVSGDTAGKVKLVHGAGGGAAQTIAEMTVANPTTSQHVYVFTKTATTVTVYCDGDLITSKAVSASPYNAFQFGTQYGGMQSGSGLSAVTDKATGGMVDYTRLYDFAISDDMIQKLAQDDPYDSSTPTYSREVSGGPWWHTADGTWLKSDDSTLVGVPDVAGIVDLTATADATMRVNLPAAPVYEKLTFQGAGAVTLVNNGNSPKIATAKLVVKTNVTAPYDIADFSGARVSVDAGKVLTFDFSTYTLESVTGVTTQQVTGVTTRADDRYAVVASAKPAWNSNLSLVYDPVEYVYSVVIAPAALVTKNNTTVAYPTVADALTALSTDAGTVRLLVDYDQDITLSAGQTLDVGSTTYSGTVSVTGTNVEIAQSGTTYAAVDNSSNTWAPAENSDNRWETAANWSNGVVPNTYTAVTFPASADGHTVKLSQNDTAPQHTCASMEIIGNVTFQRIANGSWAYVLIGGNITGSGTMTLEQVGIKSTNNVTIECPVVGNATANDNFFSTGTFTFNNTVNVAAGEFKAEYADLVFGALVTLANGGYVKTHGSGSTATFNGGISVPENAAASLTVDSGTHTIASTVTLASGATLTVPTASTTVSGATFETSVADSYVKATAGESTTVYSVAAKRTATVSVGMNASLSINGNAVADGNTVKFVPGDVLTITASADTYYTPALTVNEVSQTSPYELTTTDADVTVSATATRNTVAITIPSVDNTTVSVSYTSGGAAQVATTAGDITVDAGTDVTANWTAASGYKITSGASQTLNAVTSAQTLASPTVEAMGATVSDVNFNYGADYATATVSATVSGDATSATLSYGNTTYDANVVNGTVTFENVAITRGSDIYAPASYTITAKDGETDVTTTGGSGTTVAANVVAANWINENATTHGQQAAGGSWTNAEAVTYSEGKAAITDNRFEATTASTASRVVLEFNVCFSSVSDANVDGDAQAAIKIGEVESAATFMVLAPNSSWTPVSNADLTPDPAETYKVVLTIDYGTGSYGVTVGDNALTNATGSASFPLAASKTSVQTIDFAGSGTLTSMKGDQIEGYMVKDNAGHWYATIQEATQAYNSANGPYTVLHSGTAPSGWSIVSEGGIDILKKLAKGFFFMAY